MATEVLIEAEHGGRIEVAAGQILEVVNVDGSQICDFFAFSAADLEEVLSPTHTRTMLGRVVFGVGDDLLSRYRNPMLGVLEDTCGVHDMTMSPCDPIVYERRFGQPGHRSCRTNLAEAMEPYDVPYAFLPDPFNLFQNTPIDKDGSYRMLPSPAVPGDKIVFEAYTDIIAAGSACPYRAFGINGDAPTAIRFVVHD